MRERNSKLRSVYAVGIIVLGIVGCQEGDKLAENDQIKEQTEDVTITQTSINRPFPNVKTDYETFEVQAKKGTEWRSKNGSIIRVPANGLVDKDGNSIKGKVQFKYDEMLDMVDVFLSGVPMTYDSNGIEQHFESAGMFELRAEQNGAPVFINPKKMITVDFASDHKGNEFNLYNYNETKGKWNFRKKDKTINPELAKGLASKVGIELKMVEAELQGIKSKIGIEPEKASDKQLNFRVVYDKQLYPELAVYDDLLFQILNKEKFKPEYSNYEWSTVDIKKGENGNYKVQFVMPDLKVEYLCKPVFEGSNYERALSKFEQRYEKSQDVIVEMEKRAKERLAQYTQMQKKWTVQRAQDSLRRSLLGRSWQSKGAVMRQFEVSSFGFYNSDCPRNLPKGKRLLAELHDEKESHPDSILDYSYLYLVDKERNALFTLYRAADLSFNPASENLIWIVTEDNKLAVLYPEKFEALANISNGSKAALNMKIIDADFTSEDEIREYLNL